MRSAIPKCNCSSATRTSAKIRASTGYRRCTTAIIGQLLRRGRTWTTSNFQETRHAQIGAAVLRVLLENGKKEHAQQLVDVAWWRQWRLFATIGGPTVDYYTPLHAREKSFQDFALEFVAQQFERVLLDLDLDLPWFWDDFIESCDTVSHATHLAFWFWRAAQFWNSTAGVSMAEREWLEKKYPGWNDTFDKSWDVIEQNLAEGREDLTFPPTVPAICNTCASRCSGSRARASLTEITGAIMKAGAMCFVAHRASGFSISPLSG